MLGRCREKVVNERGASTDSSVVGAGESDDGDEKLQRDTGETGNGRLVKERWLRPCVELMRGGAAGCSHGRAGTEIAVEYRCLGRGCCASARRGHVRSGECLAAASPNVIVGAAPLACIHCIRPSVRRHTPDLPGCDCRPHHQHAATATVWNAVRPVSSTRSPTRTRAGRGAQLRACLNVRARLAATAAEGVGARHRAQLIRCALSRETRAPKLNGCTVGARLHCRGAPSFLHTPSGQPCEPRY